MIEGIKENHSKVIHNFQKITNIPRCSGEEKSISDFLFNWAKEKNLEVYQDKTMNIIIKKKASPGYENHDPILLQGHMDMVCEVSKNHVFDFSCQAIEAEIQGEYIVAPHTTLGADNGIALAMIMTLFEEEKALHPPLEALITVDEERGMSGAIHLEGKYLQARKLINLDSEDEGVCCVGCAGGQRDTVAINKRLEEKPNLLFYKISVEGLKGGHSGQDIHLGRANANKVLGRILYEIDEELSFSLSSFSGGSKSNAIPRDSQAIIGLPKEKEASLKDLMSLWNDRIKKEYVSTDPNLVVHFEKISDQPVVIDEDKKNLLSYILLAPNGVCTMSQKIPGQVESSTNLGVVEEEEDAWIITSQVRSSLASKVQEISRRNQLACELVGGSFSFGDSYPAWEYEEESILRDKASEIWKKTTGEDLKVETIHAGLECGLLQDVLGKMDMISIGPDMEGVHAPGERVSLQSTDRVYEFLLELLKSL